MKFTRKLEIKLEQFVIDNEDTTFAKNDKTISVDGVSFLTCTVNEKYDAICVYNKGSKQFDIGLVKKGFDGTGNVVLFKKPITTVGWATD